MKLMADNYEDDHLKTAPDQTNHKPSPDQVVFLTAINRFAKFFFSRFVATSVSKVELTACSLKLGHGSFLLLLFLSVLHTNQMFLPNAAIGLPCG